MECKMIVKTILLFIVVAILTGCGSEKYQYMEGGIYGTSFHISYQSPVDLNGEIRRQMEMVNASLSMFNKNSVIAKLNRNESDEVDSLFIRMFSAALRINQETGGAFDITIAPLVNAWGFGYKHDTLPSPQKVDSLLQLVGMDKVTLAGGHLRKSVAGLEMDASAIAKGLGVDLAADFLESEGVENYMVEIGGEVRVKGVNAKGMVWRVGIDKPEDDPAVQERQLQMVVQISRGALATSGNYRNFYIRDGKKYAHTIHPKTGYPVQQDILSSSVYAQDCMEADAYATAFMVLGLEKARQVVENNPALEACFIFQDNGTLKTWMSEGFRKMVVAE